MDDVMLRAGVLSKYTGIEPSLRRGGASTGATVRRHEERSAPAGGLRLWAAGRRKGTGGGRRYGYPCRFMPGEWSRHAPGSGSRSGAHLDEN